MNALSLERTGKTAALNDRLRSTFIGGQVLLSSTVAQLDDETKVQVLAAVKAFSKFESGNDPHKEHDFGSVEVEGQTYFFKIDYYDLDMRFAADDPSDEAHTKRVLTVMHASEY